MHARHALRPAPPAEVRAFLGAWPQNTAPIAGVALDTVIDREVVDEFPHMG